MSEAYRLMFISLILFVSSLAYQLPAFAAIEVEMILNDGGFESFDHFKAELYLNNLDAAVPSAWIFGILEIAGEFYYWPDFGTDLDYARLTIEPGETWLTFLEFDFPDIDDVIPFGPMKFWGAWYTETDQYGFAVKEFWLDENHKWTPTPTETPTSEPTDTPTEIPTVTPTQTPITGGYLVSTDPIVGNMRYVPATGPGGFLQGSPEDEPCNFSNENPQFTHILTRNLAVMETELTRQMWWDFQAVQPELPDDPTNEIEGAGASNPVQSVTWYECVLFANLLSLTNGYTRCYYSNAECTIPIYVTNYTTGPFYCNFAADGYRLPTEGEWEYLARAGTTGPFSCDETNYTEETCGSTHCEIGEFPVLENCAIFCTNANHKSEPVGSKLGNPWNLKDVHGNVWEWCWDWDTPYTVGTKTDFAGTETGIYRIRRGGAWNNFVQYCRSAIRYYSTPDERYSRLGVRFVRSID